MCSTFVQIKGKLRNKTNVSKEILLLFEQNHNLTKQHTVLIGNYLKVCKEYKIKLVHIIYQHILTKQSEQDCSFDCLHCADGRLYGVIIVNR